MAETIEIQPVQEENKPDVVTTNKDKGWFYTDTVKEHFFNPRNLFKTNEEAESYQYDGMGMVGSPACVSGDTLIAVADGRVSVPIKKLAEEGKEVPVYCYDGEKITISTARNIRKTREKENVLRITLNDGSLLKVTLDHKLMLRDGNYIEARDLRTGDSLMPFHKVIRNGYFYVYLNNGERMREHWMIHEHFNGLIEKSGVKNPNVHHIDENKLNNNIKNLQLMSAEEHSRLHSIKHRDHLKGVVRDIKGDKNPMRAWWNNASEKEKELYRITMSFATSGERNGRWKDISNEEILKETYEFFIIGNRELTNKNWRIFAKEKDFPQCVDSRFETFNNFKEQVLAYNHRVKSIEEDGDEDVYNLTVDPFHNYAIITNEDDVHSGIISRNCGDMMKIWIQVQDDKIKECKWQTFGCASAIASTSMMSVMISENEGMLVDDAMKLKPMDIVKRLGNLPSRKFHCSVLGDKALRAAINDYYKKNGQEDKIIQEKTRMIDHIAKVTDHDIEEAVLEGAVTFDEVQKKTKVGIGNKQCIPEVEQLIKFYKDKYYGED